MKKFIKSLQFFIFFSSQAPLVVHACSVCAYALADRFLPPIYFWMVFASLWFLALSVLSETTNIKLAGIPKILKAILLVLILNIAGLFILGPIFVLALLLVSVVSTIDLFRKIRNCSNEAKPYFVTIGIAGPICLLLMITNSLWMQTTRSAVDFYKKWKMTYQGKLVLHEIAGKGQEGRDEVITVLQIGDTEAVAIIGKAISSFDQPLNDVHFLLNAFERCKYKEDDFNLYSGKVEEVLRSLTGLDLPEGTHPKMWKEEWEKKQKGITHPMTKMITSSMDYKAKEIAYDSRFIVTDEGIVRDNTTGLEWVAGPNRDTTWYEAKRWVENLNVSGGGWRMPTRKELRNLYKRDAGTRARNPLLKPPGWYVWSDETKGSSYAWNLYFIGGSDDWYDRDYSNRLRGFAVCSQK